MALLCYNKGCGQKYNADQNKDGKSGFLLLFETFTGLLLYFGHEDSVL